MRRSEDGSTRRGRLGRVKFGFTPRKCRRLAAVIFAIAIAGCEPDSPGGQLDRQLRDVPVEFDHGEYDLGDLEGEILVDDDALGLPITVAIVGDWLVVGDGTLSPPIHVFRFSDGARLGSLGARGEGPGEFSSTPRLLQASANEREVLWGFDPALARLTEIPLDLPLDDKTPEVLRLSLDFPVLDLGFVSDGTLVGWPLTPMARVVRIDREGRLIEGIGEIPDPEGLRGLHEGFRQRAYQPFLSVVPGGSRLAIASWKASRLDLVDLDSLEGVITTEGPFPFIADVEVPETLQSNRLVRGPRNRTGHVGVVATEQAVLTLFSGRLERAFRDRMDEADFLHVYHWDGSFVRAFRLDRPARAMACADESCDTLITLVWSPNPAVVRYDLPQGWHLPN